MPLVKIKDFNALIENKTFLGQPVQKKQEAHENQSEWQVFSSHQSYYRLVGMGLWRQTNTSIPQQINFVEKLEEDNRATMFLIVEKSQKTVL